MKIIDNINTLLGDDLKTSITSKSKVKIAASCFSIYAFEELKVDGCADQSREQLHLARVPEIRHHVAPQQFRGRPLGVLERLPVARRIGGNGVEDARHRHGQFGVRRIQKMPRHEQFSKRVGDHDMDLPFPAGRTAAHQPHQFAIGLFDKTKVIEEKFRVPVAPDFLVPELQARPAKPETDDGQMPVGRRDISPRFAHVHQPDLFRAPKCKTSDLVLQFAFAGLDPEQMRARLFKTLMAIHVHDPARPDGK